MAASVVLAFACAPGDRDPGTDMGSVPGAGQEGQPTEMPSPATSRPVPGFPVTLIDASGRRMIFPAPPQRIVSLVPSATRTLEAIGARSLLVGRTEYDTAASLAPLPSVGGGLQPSLEALLALRPDLVIRHSGESDRATPLHLDEMGVRHLSVRTDRMEDVRTLVRDLGMVTGRSYQADSVLADMDAAFQEIRHRLAGRPPVSVAYVLGGHPPWVAGPGTFIHELLASAGGENAFADLKALYGPVSIEELLVRRIDVLLAPEGAEVLLPSSSLRVVRVSPEIEVPGPDLARFVRELAALLHPQVFR